MKRHAVSIAAYAGALVLGLLLFTLPFVRYGLAGGHTHAGKAHVDHDARHGGHLMMLGQTHVELVDNGGRVELYLSDARRVPLRPTSCEVVFDGTTSQPCVWEHYRSVIPKPDSARVGLYKFALDKSSELELKYP